MLQGLEQIVADTRFDDWLFVFGTAMPSEKVLKSSPKKKGDDGNDDNSLAFCWTISFITLLPSIKDTIQTSAILFQFVTSGAQGSSRPRRRRCSKNGEA
jgi:hypothetical protein